tara:strand:+ start:245 stop:1342 length:1098 start_codon:yes stop_codon:yes gene_type:complete
LAKDYTKYTVEGLGENLNKRQLVFAIVKNWAAKNNPSLEEIQTAFPTETQGSKGFIMKASEVKDAKRFNMQESLSIKNGTKVVVSNQWGAENIAAFLALVENLGYNVSVNSGQNKTDLNESESFLLYNDIYSGDIRDHIEDILKSGDKERCQLFKKSVIDFINNNHASYWVIPFVKDCLVGFENKSDDEGLGWEKWIEELNLAGRELDFNPKKNYCLFYDSFDEAFRADEDEDETDGFFDLIMKLHFSNSSDFNSLTTKESEEFHNTGISTLYCTICKMCEDDISQRELVDALVLIMEEDFVTKFEAGDLVWSIIEETLVALGVDLDEYKDEGNLWRDMYLVNFDDVATFLIENDVFDHDYIPSK